MGKLTGKIKLYFHISKDMKMNKEITDDLKSFKFKNILYAMIMAICYLIVAKFSQDVNIVWFVFVLCSSYIAIVIYNNYYKCENVLDNDMYNNSYDNNPTDDNTIDYYNSPKSCSSGTCSSGTNSSETHMAPVLDPRFNLREVTKNMILLEDHLFHQEKRCPDCCLKHALTIEALLDEGISLDKEMKYNEVFVQTINNFSQISKKIEHDIKTNSLEHQNCLQYAQQLRHVRKPLMYIVAD